MDKFEKLKIMIDEENYPYFSDSFLQLQLEELKEDNNITLENIARDLILIKAGIEELKIGDVIIPSPKNHFLRLSQKYRNISGNGSRVVERADGQ